MNKSPAEILRIAASSWFGMKTKRTDTLYNTPDEALRRETEMPNLAYAFDALAEEIEHNYVKLPTDALGQTIRLGDKLELVKTGRSTLEAEELILKNNGWLVGHLGNYYNAQILRHPAEAPQTLEDRKSVV